MELSQIQYELKKCQNEKRYAHSTGVMYTAASLAMAHGSDIAKAMYAGLLHDCAKCYPADIILNMCVERSIPVTEVERKSPFLLHAKLGEDFAINKYGIRDKDICSAIRWHTTGKVNMTLLEKIIFTADYIEPQRDKASNLSEIRRLAFSDIDRSVFYILRDTLYFLKQRNRCIDCATNEAYEYYKKISGSNYRNKKMIINRTV